MIHIFTLWLIMWLFNQSSTVAARAKEIINAVMILLIFAWAAGWIV
jgi:hypothetical protein